MKKPIPRLPDENPPPYTCSECWFYESQTIEHGACFAVPPTVLMDTEGDLLCPRSVVMADDRGCIHWKPRQQPN